MTGPTGDDGLCGPLLSAISPILFDSPLNEGELLTDYQEALYQLFGICTDHLEYLQISDAGFQSL